MSDQVDEIDDEAFGITDRLLADVMAAVEARDAAAIEALLDPLHPADIAHLASKTAAICWMSGRAGWMVTFFPS